MESNNSILEAVEILPTYMIGNEIRYENKNAVIKKFEISSKENTVVYFEGITHPHLFEKMIEGLDSIELLSSKIQFLKTAFKNRTKQYNFSQLTCHLLENNISESDFEDEIEKHSDNYAISVSEMPIRMSDLDVLTCLISELKSEGLMSNDVSVDEVAELFEVNLDDATERIAQLKLKE